MARGVRKEAAFKTCVLWGWGRTHLYFQLLYHLHLDSTLGCAAVVKCMFGIEVSGEKNTGGLCLDMPIMLPTLGVPKVRRAEGKLRHKGSQANWAVPPPQTWAGGRPYSPQQHPGVQEELLVDGKSLRRAGAARPEEQVSRTKAALWRFTYTLCGNP